MGARKFLRGHKKEDADGHDHKRREESDSSHGPAHDESNWLVSYADMMTLLCGFFVLLFSMAKLDEPEFERVKKAVAKQFGGEYKSPNEELTKYITQVLEEIGIHDQTVLRSDASGIEIVFQSTIFFETLSSNIKPEGMAVLTKLIEAIANRQATDNKEYKIVVEGHTDSRPIIGGIYPSNWELSSARAARVIRMFLDHGFGAARLTAIGYADTRPEFETRTASGTLDEQALAKNRRVVIRILEPKVTAIPLPQAATPPVSMSEPAH